MLQRFIFITIFILIISLPTYAEHTGNDLLRGCSAILKVADGISTSEEEQIYSLFWTGYITGFTDSYSISLMGNKPTIYCYPNQGIEVGQSARIISKYLKNNPKDLHKSARLCILLSLIEAFPCEK